MIAAIIEVRSQPFAGTAGQLSSVPIVCMPHLPDGFALLPMLTMNRSETVRDPETKEYYRLWQMKDPAVPGGAPEQRINAIPEPGSDSVPESGSLPGSGSSPGSASDSAS